MPGALANPGVRPLLGAGAAIVLLLVAGLAWVLWPGGPGRSGTGYPGGLVPSAATAPPSAVAPPGVAPSGAAPSGAAHPGATGGAGAANQGQKGFLDDLGAIDPGLTADPDAALAGGRATCQD